MKTLLKLGKNPGCNIPVLKTVKVDNLTMTATDLDIWILQPAEGIKPGLYHAEGFDKGLRLPYTAGKGEVDYPAPFAMGDKVGLAEVDLGDLSYVRSCASTQESRYYLCGVCFKERDLIATDGHRLAKITYGENFGFPAHPIYKTGVVVNSAAVDYVLALGKEHEKKTAIATFYAQGLEFRIGPAILRTKLVDGTFPDYARIVPNPDKMEYITAFDPADFKAKAAEIRSIAKIHGMKRGDSIPVALGAGKARTAFTSHGDNVEFITKSSLPFEIGFNLEYLLALQAGEMKFNDAVSPVVITNGNRLQVLMPVRLAG